MNEARRSRLRAVMSLVFVVSLMLALSLQRVGPKLLAPFSPTGASYYNPLWLTLVAYGFGLIAVCTVPFAWRWLYRRGK